MEMQQVGNENEKPDSTEVGTDSTVTTEVAQATEAPSARERLKATLANIRARTTDVKQKAELAKKEADRENEQKFGEYMAGVAHVILEVQDEIATNEGYLQVDLNAFRDPSKKAVAMALMAEAPGSIADLKAVLDEIYGEAQSKFGKSKEDVLRWVKWTPYVDKAERADSKQSLVNVVDELVNDRVILVIPERTYNQEVSLRKAIFEERKKRANGESFNQKLADTQPRPVLLVYRSGEPCYYGADMEIPASKKIIHVLIDKQRESRRGRQQLVEGNQAAVDQIVAEMKKADPEYTVPTLKEAVTGKRGPVALIFFARPGRNAQGQQYGFVMNFLDGKVEIVRAVPEGEDVENQYDGIVGKFYKFKSDPVLPDLEDLPKNLRWNITAQLKNEGFVVPERAEAVSPGVGLESLRGHVVGTPRGKSKKQVEEERERSEARGRKGNRKERGGGNARRFE